MIYIPPQAIRRSAWAAVAAAGIGTSIAAGYTALAWAWYGHVNPGRHPRDDLLELGRGVLAEDPGREILVGACTQPWRSQVQFHSLPPEEFAAFAGPGYVKIAWTLAAEPRGEDGSVFITRTRAVATGQEARRKFRRYWAPMPAGIILIRYLGFPLVKHEAERRARVAAPSTHRGSHEPDAAASEHAAGLRATDAR